MRTQRPNQKGIKPATAVTVILVATVMIVSVAYLFTRTGGIHGQTTLQQMLVDRAKAAGYSSPGEMFRARFGGGEKKKATPEKIVVNEREAA